MQAECFGDRASRCPPASAFSGDTEVVDVRHRRRDPPRSPWDAVPSVDYPEVQLSVIQACQAGQRREVRRIITTDWNGQMQPADRAGAGRHQPIGALEDRKSKRLNSSN